MNEPTHLDLFSGIGGFSLAAERCGFRTIGFSEIDPYASAVLSKWWPNVTNHGDIRNIKSGSVDLITGGFPCQPFSVAGQMRGDSDERHLWPELVRVISEIRPSFCLLENVPGLLSNDAGRVFGDILRDLAEIRYDALWNCVSASAIGANHRRERVWIIAYTSSPRGRIQSKSRREVKDQAESFNDGTKRNVADTRCKSERNESQRFNSKPELGEATRLGTSERDRPSNGSWWTSEPSICRMAHGIPKRVDRLRCLGNSIVPQVAEIFLKGIYQQLTTDRKQSER